MEDDLMEKIKRAAEILKSFGAKEVYLFGSALNDDFDMDNSDIDLAVRGIPPRNFYGAVGEMLCTLHHDIDVIDLDNETPFGRFLEKHKELKRVL